MATIICSLVCCLRYVIIFQVLFHPVRPGIKFAWTLSPRFVNFDIKNDDFHGAPICSTKGPAYPDIGYDSLRLLENASPFTHIDIQVIDTQSFNKFSVMVFVYLTNDEGTIIQIQQDRPGSLFKYIGVFYNTTNLFVQTTDFSLADHVTVTSHDPIQKNEWVGVSVVYDNNMITLFVGESMTGPVAVSHELKLMFPGVVRVGSGFMPGLIDAAGMMTCLHVHDSMIGTSDFSSILDTCSYSQWPSSFMDALDQVSGSCSNKTGHFTLFYENFMPESSIVIDQLETPSRIRCADWCMRDASCLSFSMNPSTRSCILYSAHANLVMMNGTNYYVRSELLECC